MITVYKDGAEIAKTASKREANKAIRDSYTPGAKYEIEDENGRRQLSVAQRKNGQLQINDFNTIQKWLDERRASGEYMNITFTVSTDEYAAIKAAADHAGQSVWSWAKSVVVAEAKKT